MEDIDIQAHTDQFLSLVMAYAPKVLLALATLIIGFWLIGKLCRVLEAALMKNAADKPLIHFLSNLANYSLKALLLISVASMIGVETTSFIAALGAAGLAIGLALQGSLSNFAGGVLILIFKPFKEGDVIEAQGFLGVVRDIQIFNTIMVTLDNQRVVIPNGPLSNGPVKNLFVESTRRIDLTFGISYSDSMKGARAVIEDIIAKDARILKDPVHDIFVSAHADSSVNLLVRVWVESENYWPVHFALIEEVKEGFDANGISIPFPQHDVHMISAE